MGFSKLTAVTLFATSTMILGNPSVQAGNWGCEPNFNDLSRFMSYPAIRGELIAYQDHGQPTWQSRGQGPTSKLPVAAGNHHQRRASFNIPGQDNPALHDIPSGYKQSRHSRHGQDQVHRDRNRAADYRAQGWNFRPGPDYQRYQPPMVRNRMNPQYDPSWNTRYYPGSNGYAAPQSSQREIWRSQPPNPMAWSGSRWPQVWQPRNGWRPQINGWRPSAGQYGYTRRDWNGSGWPAGGYSAPAWQNPYHSRQPVNGHWPMYGSRWQPTQSRYSRWPVHAPAMPEYSVRPVFPAAVNLSTADTAQPGNSKTPGTSESDKSIMGKIISGIALELIVDKPAAPATPAPDPSYSVKPTSIEESTETKSAPGIETDPPAAPGSATSRTDQNDGMPATETVPGGAEASAMDTPPSPASETLSLAETAPTAAQPGKPTNDPVKPPAASEASSKDKPDPAPTPDVSAEDDGTKAVSADSIPDPRPEQLPGVPVTRKLSDQPPGPPTDSQPPVPGNTVPEDMAKQPEEQSGGKESSPKGGAQPGV
ncbi:MAG: hypothetical protein GY703_22810 [Gammaproteobacteria bacterium]|nr:hypothetical protein [Gammaproteobacteria bacterium]